MDDNDLDEINRLLIKIKKDNNNNESMEHIINLTTILANFHSLFSLLINFNKRYMNSSLEIT